MERAIIHSDLAREAIQPPSLLNKYLDLLQSDINKLLLKKPLEDVGCPVCGEIARRESFQKMGMTFNVSKKLGNIYISPRPSPQDLREFYLESSARKFWLTEFWNNTYDQRIAKVVIPQLEWVNDSIMEHISRGPVEVTEMLANNWGYASLAEGVIADARYHLASPLVPDALLPATLRENVWPEGVENESQDAVLMFEALDRSTDPQQTLSDAKAALKSGGLCFITCLLSSGFEPQILREESDIFIPPERMNLLSYEGMVQLVEGIGGLDIVEFSTPGVLDIQNVIEKLPGRERFLNYIFKERSDTGVVRSFQEFLQLNRLATFGRLVLKKRSV
jgi:hypothetical protein